MLSGSVLRGATLIAAALSALLIMPFIVHRLGDRLYGFWSLAATFIGYYGLLDLGISSAVSQYVCIAIGRKDSEECAAVFNAALRIQILLGCLALLATGVIAAAVPFLYRDPEAAPLFWKVIVILGVTAALSFPIRVYSGVLEAQLRFDIQAGLDLSSVLLRTGLMVLALASGGSLLALAWATFFSSLPVMVLQVWFARREASWARVSRSSLDLERTKHLFSYSLYTFVASLADTVRFQLDAIVISAFIGLAAVTHYRIASVLVKYFRELLLALVRLFQPVMSRLHGAKDKTGIDKVFYFATKVTLSASVFICFSVIAWGKPFITRWMGVGYVDAYWPVVILSLAVFLDVSQSPSIELLYATFKHRYYTYMNLGEGIVNLLFSLILVHRFGILGVALGTLIGAVISRIAIQPIVVCRVCELSYPQYVKFFGRNLILYGCLMALAVLISFWGLKPTYFLLVSSAVCCTVAYVAGSWIFSLDPSERQSFSKAIMNRHSKQAEITGMDVAL